MAADPNAVVADPGMAVSPDVGMMPGGGMGDGSMMEINMTFRVSLWLLQRDPAGLLS
jgi:hypothetical protein